MRNPKIFISIILAVLLGFSGSLFTVSEITNWYAQLVKPAWNPPNWLFGPVWTILYILMGISFGMLWNSQGPDKAFAMRIFIFQFLLNLLWSFIFFRLHLIGFALIEIWLLFIFIVLTVIASLRVNRTSAFLLLPYLLWVLFASVLNQAIWILNK